MGNIPTNANELFKKHAVVGLGSYKDLDDTIGEMYRSSYFNPSVYAARFETLASAKQPVDVVKGKLRSIESESIIKSMEKRINKYGSKNAFLAPAEIESIVYKNAKEANKCLNKNKILKSELSKLMNKNK